MRKARTLSASAEAARLMLVVSLILEDARKKRGIRKKDLAEKMGVSRARVSRVLNGWQNVTLGSLASFADALGVQIIIKGKVLKEGLTLPPSRLYEGHYE